MRTHVMAVHINETRIVSHSYEACKLCPYFFFHYAGIVLVNCVQENVREIKAFSWMADLK